MFPCPPFISWSLTMKLTPSLGINLLFKELRTLVCVQIQFPTPNGHYFRSRVFDWRRRPSGGVEGPYETSVSRYEAGEVSEEVGRTRSVTRSVLPGCHSVCFGDRDGVSRTLCFPVIISSPAYFLSLSFVCRNSLLATVICLLQGLVHTVYPSTCPDRSHLYPC